MATTNVVKKDVTFAFDDGTPEDYTRKVTFGNFGEDAMTEQEVDRFRDAIKAFNSSDVSLVSAFYGYTTSDDTQTVYPVKGIKEANIVQTIKTPVYARDAEALARALAADTEGE